jgi:hypothetical protein
MWVETVAFDPPDLVTSITASVNERLYRDITTIMGTSLRIEQMADTAQIVKLGTWQYDGCVLHGVWIAKRNFDFYYDDGFEDAPEDLNEGQGTIPSCRSQGWQGVERWAGVALYLRKPLKRPTASSRKVSRGTITESSLSLAAESIAFRNDNRRWVEMSLTLCGSYRHTSCPRSMHYERVALLTGVYRGDVGQESENSGL